MFSDAWSENAALFERLMEIHSNPPIRFNKCRPMVMDEHDTLEICSIVCSVSLCRMVKAIDQSIVITVY